VADKVIVDRQAEYGRAGTATLTLPAVSGAPALIQAMSASNSSALNRPGWPPFCCTCTRMLLSGSLGTIAGPSLPPFKASA